MPGNFDKCGNAEDRRGILMHEFAHVRRFDAGVNVLQIIAQGIFWFHPFVWMANTMIRREREKCCDEAAIAGLKTVPRDYGKAIIDALTREYESNMPVPSLAIAGPVKNIEDRIKTIMRPGKKFYGRCGIFAIITVILLAAIALPTGCVLTRRGKTAEPQQEVIKPVEEGIGMVKMDQGGMGGGVVAEVRMASGSKYLIIKHRLIMADSEDIKKLVSDGNVLTFEKMNSFSDKFKTLQLLYVLVDNGTETAYSTKDIEWPGGYGKPTVIDISGTMFPHVSQDGKSVLLDFKLKLEKRGADDTSDKVTTQTEVVSSTMVPDGGTVLVSLGEKFSVMALAPGKELFLLVKADATKDEAASIDRQEAPPEELNTQKIRKRQRGGMGGAGSKVEVYGSVEAIADFKIKPVDERLEDMHISIEYQLITADKDFAEKLISACDKLEDTIKAGLASGKVERISKSVAKAHDATHVSIPVHKYIDITGSKQKSSVHGNVLVFSQIEADRESIAIRLNSNYDFTIYDGAFKNKLDSRHGMGGPCVVRSGRSIAIPLGPNCNLSERKTTVFDHKAFDS